MPVQDGWSREQREERRVPRLQVHATNSSQGHRQNHLKIFLRSRPAPQSLTCLLNYWLKRFKKRFHLGVLCLGETCAKRLERHAAALCRHPRLFLLRRCFYKLLCARCVPGVIRHLPRLRIEWLSFCRRRDVVNFVLVEETEPADRKRHPALCLGDGLQDRISASLAFQSVRQGYHTEILVNASGTILGAHMHRHQAICNLARHDLNRDTVKFTELIGTVALSVQRQLAVKRDVGKRLCQRVKTEGPANLPIVPVAFPRR